MTFHRSLLLLAFAVACAPVESGDVSLDQPPQAETPVVVTPPVSDPVETPDVDATPDPVGSGLPAPALPASSAPTLVASLLNAQRQTWCNMIEDFDNDGWNDIIFVDNGASTWQVRWGRGDGTFDLSTLTVPNMGMGACTVHNLSDDDDLDVLVALRGKSGGLEIGPGRTLTWVESTLPAADLPSSRPSFVLPIDLDHQGKLDLLVGYGGDLNDECGLLLGDTTVEMAAGNYSHGEVICLVHGTDGWTVDQGDLCPSPVLPDGVFVPFAAAVEDLNQDGTDDVLLANDFGANTLLFGSPDGGLHRAPAGNGLEVYNHGMGVAIDDFNGDNLADVFVSDYGVSDVYIGASEGLWFESSANYGLVEATNNLIGWGVNSFDLDRNGANDVLFTTSGELVEDFAGTACDLWASQQAAPPAVALLNSGTGFTRQNIDFSQMPRGIASFDATFVASGDLDGDGDPDAVVAYSEGAVYLENRTPPVGRWLRVRAVDSHGLAQIGATVKVTDEAGHAWRRTQHVGSGTAGPSEITADFGLGGAVGLLRVEVIRADGSTQVREGVAADQMIVVDPG